jgi:uncharacterized membrane protein
MREKLKNIGLLLADKVASFIGSWVFIISQSIILIIWLILNIKHIVHFDPYPFILLNLILSFQAAYATPMILMSGNRQSQRDRAQAEKDLNIDEDSNKVIKNMSKVLTKLNKDILLDRQALADHKVSREEHENLKNQILDLSKKIDKLIKQTK